MGFVSWFRRNFAQDDFGGDWYGWLTNQISHIGLGVALALVLSGLWFWAAGEFPVKLIAWPCLLLGYLAAEFLRGWSGLDSVEDTVFVAGYGCGGAFLLFTEIEPGQPLLVVSVADVLPVLGVAVAHLIVGVWKRA